MTHPSKRPFVPQQRDTVIDGPRAIHPPAVPLRRTAAGQDAELLAARLLLMALPRQREASVHE